MSENRTTKALLRKEVLQMRRELSVEQILIYNARLALFFSELPFSNVRYIHSYFPIATRIEPDSLLLLRWLHEYYPEIHRVLPKSDFNNSSLRHFVWDERAEMGVGPAGIPEPVDGIEVDPLLLDIILVPLLAFDIHGNRVGYGKGFYDRFLAQCRPDALKIGLSFFNPINEITEVSSFDIPLDACITPEKIWWFNEVWERTRQSQF